jgi:hypothetical protein
MIQRNRIGELRPSQLLHTYGVGATVELPEITTLVLGLDEWPELRVATTGGGARDCRRTSATVDQSSGCKLRG